MRKNYALRVVKFVLIAILCVAVLAALGFVVKGLWNWLMPGLFGFKLIGYWQAVGVIVLSRLLFGGIGRSGGRGRYGRHGMKERCAEMTPEEREKFRQWFQGRWGGVAPAEKPGV